MIRINLLAGERRRSKPKGAAMFAAGQRLALAVTGILILAALFIGWRYWTLSRDSARVDAEIAAAQKETTRLHAIIQQVQQFEQRKAQLQQRVVLIEQLRKGQTGPVHMLDQISRALPPMLWLTELKQTGDDVVISGRCTTLTALSDFVANLEASGYFKRSVEIMSSQTEPAPGGELVGFKIKAVFQTPGDAATGAAAAAAAGTAVPAATVGQVAR
jgi:type IV pilus assembly protein PilN